MTNTATNPTTTTPLPYQARILQRLTGAQWRILLELDWLLTCRQRKHPEKAQYVEPGQTYLATKAGVTRSWANRCIRELHQLGILTKTYRRKANGIFHTCLYTLSAAAMWPIRRWARCAFTGSNRVNNTAQKRQGSISKTPPAAPRTGTFTRAAAFLTPIQRR